MRYSDGQRRRTEIHIQGKKMEEEDDKNLTPGGDGSGDNPGGEAGDGKPTDEGAQPTEFEIDGQKYTPDQLKEALKLSQDYKYFVPEFTKKSQALAEYEKLGKLDDIKKIVAAPSNGNPQIDQAKKILKEQLGVVTKEDVEQLMNEIKEIKESGSIREGNAQLESVNKFLAGKYDGKKGEPAFKIEEVAKVVNNDPNLAVYVNVNGQFLIDLEQTYKRIHGDFWDKLPEIKAKVVKTERGSQIQTKTPSNSKIAETEKERTEDAVNFFKSSKVEE